MNRGKTKKLRERVIRERLLRKRARVVCVRLTTEEHRMLTKAAKYHDVTMSDLVRQLIVRENKRLVRAR